MYLSHLHIKNHPILKDIDLDLLNPKTNKPYPIIAFVGENGCGKTTLLNVLFDYEYSGTLYYKFSRGIEIHKSLLWEWAVLRVCIVLL